MLKICFLQEKVKVQVEALNFEDVGGVFLIMISGVMLSWLFAGWSFLWNVRNLAIRYDVIACLIIRIPCISYRNCFYNVIKTLCFTLQVSYRDQIVEELRFLAKCSSKKVVKKRETIKSNSTDC